MNMRRSWVLGGAMALLSVTMVTAQAPSETQGARPRGYAAPFTLRLTITSQPDYEMYEYSCHEGNGAVKYALSADREYERQVAEAKAKGLPPPARVMGMAVYTGQAVEGREEIRELGGSGR
jgi:hypothetical protein